MRPIEVSSNKSRIFFNTEIYDMYPITKVCERFEDVVKIKLRLLRDEGLIEITLKPKSSDDLEKTTYEFCNHVLHEQTMVLK